MDIICGIRTDFVASVFKNNYENRGVYYNLQQTINKLLPEDVNINLELIDGSVLSDGHYFETIVSDGLVLTMKYIHVIGYVVYEIPMLTIHRDDSRKRIIELLPYDNICKFVGGKQSEYMDKSSMQIRLYRITLL